MNFKFLLSPFIYVYHGIVELFKAIGKFFRYVFLGIMAFPTIMAKLFTPTNTAKKPVIKSQKTENRYKKTELLLAEHNREKNIKTNKDTPKEKESFSKKLSKLLNTKIGSTEIKDKYKDTQEMIINYNGPEAKKTSKKRIYEYIARNPEGKIVKGYFAAYSLVEVHSYLKTQGYKIYKIKTNMWINFSHNSVGKTGDKFKTHDLIFFLAQVSTYLKVGIPLAEAIKILTKQFKNEKYKRILATLSYDLTTGKSFSEALAKQGNTFPNILINMVKTAEMTGELPETLDDMEAYFTEIEATRKAMITAMMYPAIIFVIAIGVGTFIMLYVVPKFIEIYNTMDSTKIPAITSAVLALSQFLQKYIIYIGISIVILLILSIYLYKNVKAYRKTVQWILMHLPVFGSVIIYKEVTTFTKTFSSLLSHNVFITDSMKILNKVTNNEIYKELIQKAINNISQGKSISLAFKNQWAFPLPAYEMIVTGERSGQLPEMMYKISLYYQDLHKNSVTRIKTFVEPALIIMLTAMVGVIVLSIVVPMFSMYSQIQA